MQPEVSAGDVFAIGNLLPNAARHNGNLVVTHTVAWARSKAWTRRRPAAGGERFTSLDNSILLPGFGRVDASAFYTVRRGSRADFRLQMDPPERARTALPRVGHDVGHLRVPGRAPRTPPASAAATRRSSGMAVSGSAGMTRVLFVVRSVEAGSPRASWCSRCACRVLLPRTAPRLRDHVQAATVTAVPRNRRLAYDTLFFRGGPGARACISISMTTVRLPQGDDRALEIL